MKRVYGDISDDSSEKEGPSLALKMDRTSRRQPISSMNLSQLVFTAQYTGKGATNLYQLSTDLIDEVTERMDWDDVPDTVMVLSDLSVDLRYNPQDCLNELKRVQCKLTNFEARRSHDADAGDDAYTKYGKNFIACGGVEVLLRLLMHSSVLPPKSIYSNDTEVRLRCKSLVLEILIKLVSQSEGDKLAKQLTEDDDLLRYTFNLLAHTKTCLMACQFIEDLLQARTNVLNLNSITNLRSLLHCLDDNKLANFCKILAVTISDLDIYENKSSLFAQNKQKRSKGFVNIRDINQEMLLGIPELLARLVNIATAKTYTPRYSGMMSEVDCWMEWIDNSLADSAFEEHIIDDFDDFMGGISEMATPESPMVRQSGLQISNDLILRVQVVYVLGLFLVGKHRKKVQRKLAELQLVPGLSDLFDQFLWKCQTRRNNTRHMLRGHNNGCECSPEVALKIQFLRLVHSFCDHSEYKHLLLSKSELNEIMRINAKAGPLAVEKLDLINKQLMCRGSKGLLTKIVEVMKKEPTASTFRFWLARAVESYLRGSTSYCDQVFLLRRGLLQHIASNIVEHDSKPKEILQSSFDLLGELIKFNIDAFKAFDKVLQNKFERFIAIVNRNLVDSNMFIRSLMLSYEHFCTVQPEYKEYATNECRLLMHVADFKLQMDYLRKLINLINVQNLTQENVSCLNTTLVFLMFANQKSALPKFLAALSRSKPSSSECSTANHNIMKNFRDLLMFWQDHYLHKDKDCSALEKSSRICFDYWKQTVNTLVLEDRNNKAAIISFVDPVTGRDS